MKSHKQFLLFCYVFFWFVVGLNPVGVVSARSADKESLCQEKPKIFSFKIPFLKAVSVFKRDGSRQCEEDTGTPAKEMAQELKSVGIRVLKSVKGHLSRGRGMALCGSPTQNINIFYISAKHEKKALEKGFHSCKLGEKAPQK